MSFYFLQVGSTAFNKAVESHKANIINSKILVELVLILDSSERLSGDDLTCVDTFECLVDFVNAHLDSENDLLNHGLIILVSRNYNLLHCLFTFIVTLGG